MALLGWVESVRLPGVVAPASGGPDDGGASSGFFPTSSAVLESSLSLSFPGFLDFLDGC